MPFSLTNPCGALTRNEDANGPTCTNPAGFRTDHVGEGRCYLHGGIAGGRLKHGRYSKILKVELRDAIKEQLEDPAILSMEEELAAGRALFVNFINRYEETTDALIAWYQSYKEVNMTPERLDMLRQVIYRYDKLVADDMDVPAFMQSYVKECKSLVQKYKEYYDTAANFKPQQVLDITEAYKFLAEITKIVERIEKVRAQNAISRRNFIRVMNEMGRTVNTVLDVMGGSVHLFDPLGNSIKAYDAAGEPIDIQQVFQDAKEKIQQQWSTIRVE